MRNGRNKKAKGNFTATDIATLIGSFAKLAGPKSPPVNSAVAKKRKNKNRNRRRRRLAEYQPGPSVSQVNARRKNTRLSRDGGGTVVPHVPSATTGRPLSYSKYTLEQKKSTVDKLQKYGHARLHRFFKTYPDNVSIAPPPKPGPIASNLIGPALVAAQLQQVAANAEEAKKWEDQYAKTYPTPDTNDPYEMTKTYRWIRVYHKGTGVLNLTARIRVCLIEKWPEAFDIEKITYDQVKNIMARRPCLETRWNSLSDFWIKLPVDVNNPDEMKRTVLLFNNDGVGASVDVQHYLSIRMSTGYEDD